MKNKSWMIECFRPSMALTLVPNVR